MKAKSYPLNQSPLYKLPTRRKLASLLGISIATLSALGKGDELYKEFYQPKKNGEKRLVEAPSKELKKVQRRVYQLLARIRPPGYLFCPAKGKSYLSNAGHHLGARVVRTMDLKKYFPSTSERRVRLFFKDVMKCPPDVVRALTALACYKGHLPTGSPLSPIMAHFAHYDVWEMIAVATEAAGCKHTVYVDDLTISGDQVPGTLRWEIAKIIHASGLRYHKEKAFIGKPAEITGVVLKDGNILLPNRQHKKLHKLRDQLRVTKEEKARDKLKSKIKGLEQQARQVCQMNVQLKGAQA